MIILKNEISNNLALRTSAKRLFDMIKKDPNQVVEVDFIDIVSITRSFANEYVENKRNTLKTIREINVPLNVRKMLEIVDLDSPRRKLIETEKIQPIKL